MRITELLTRETILLSMRASAKQDAVDELVGVLERAGKITDRNVFKEAILKRELQSTTGVGDGIAIPRKNFSREGCGNCIWPVRGWNRL